MDSDAPEERSFQEREADLLRELSSLYTKLNQVREKRAKVEQETSSAASTEDTSDRRRRRRVILVTRSLPFTLTAEDAQSQWRAEFHENLTLDAAMETYMCLHETYDCVWIGSVNGEVEQSEQNTLKEQLHQDRNYYPVFLDPKREKLFYQGFCKTILWPLFHSSPPTTEDQLISQEMDNEADERNVMEKMWQAYVAVNQSFADAVQEVYEEGDLVWVQGYHLSLVPQMVRNLFPNSNIHIGFFMHTPFPSSELYRILNYREEMLAGVLGADLIGFQTYEYARHFQSSVVRLLGLESSHKGVDVDGHFARITICPVGIDPEKFTALARSDGVNDQIRQLRAQFAGKTVMLGMDQLDPTKGLVHKLLAVEELFTLRPELSREVVFVQIVTGGTSALESPLGAQVEALVSRINSKLQDIGADAPVQYLNQELPRDMLIALYALADCIVITPVQEGMNAMPFEYVVCREAVGKHARIVLSEFAGSAHSLGGAKLVNPWNTEELHDALLASLQDSEGVMSAHQSMYSYVSTFTSRHWADNFLEQLEECCEENNLAVSGRELSRRDMTSAYTRSSRRLIFINYEGVMAAEASIPELSYPPQELIWQLSMLTDDPRNTVVLVCARSMAVCEQWFAGLSGRIVLAAEYGVYVKWIGENEPWRCVVPNLDLDWWEDVEPLLEYYTERTPGSFMERKDSSVTWHYRDCDQDHGLWQASELLISLRELTRSLPVAVVPGNRYLEVRPQKVSKASLFERIWEFMNYSSLFPNEEPVTTEYFGELARPSTSPMVKPNPGPPLSADRWRAKEKDELAKFRLEDSDRSSPWRRRTSDTNNADPADMDESSLTDEEDTIMASDQTVDFVVVIAAGEDRTDEDLFSVLVPPPIDLEAYCRQLDKDELRMEKKLSESALLAHDEELSMLNDGDSIRRRSSWNNNGLSASPTAPILGAGSLEDTTFIQLTPKSSFRRLLSRDNMLASVGSQGNVLDPELLPLARLPSQGTDGHSGKPTISDDAATMFPRALLATPATARRDEITEKSKFTPRRDFPPSAALFKAMKTKYGESFGMHKIPNTPAECWALVCPPTARAKLEDSTLDRKASVGSTSQPVAAVTVIKEVDEVLSEPEASVVVEGDDDELKVVVEKLVRVRSSSSRLDESDDVSEVERYLFPVNTFVCTLGRKLSQAPYYIKNSADLYQLLQEMGLSSHLRRQRLLSQNVGRSVSPLHGENELFAGDEGEIEAEVALAAALAH